MSAVTLPPPTPPICLTRSYKSRGCKGGTVIAEDVRDLKSHREKLRDPDAYRSVIGSCWACGSKALHAHCFRERSLRGLRNKPPVVETIRLYRCAGKSCGAVFTVLPAVICRHLWRLWQTVEQSVGGKLEVPTPTRSRWLARLCSSASQLVQTLAAQASSLVSAGFCSALAKVTTRRDLVDALCASLSEPLDALAFLAGWIHRLQPGIRLM